MIFWFYCRDPRINNARLIQRGDEVGKSFTFCGHPVFRQVDSSEALGCVQRRHLIFRLGHPTGFPCACDLKAGLISACCSFTSPIMFRSSPSSLNMVKSPFVSFLLVSPPGCHGLFSVLYRFLPQPWLQVVGFPHIFPAPPNKSVFG